MKWTFLYPSPRFSVANNVIISTQLNFTYLYLHLSTFPIDCFKANPRHHIIHMYLTLKDKKLFYKKVFPWYYYPIFQSSKNLMASN